MLTNNWLDDEVNSKTIYNRIKKQEVPEINLTKKVQDLWGKLWSLMEKVCYICVYVCVCVLTWKSNLNIFMAIQIIWNNQDIPEK